jgi:excisionase family DNA binding protein
VNPSDDHLSLDETADLLRISRTRTRQLIREGKLEAAKEGDRFRVTRASVYARISKQPTPSGVLRTLYFARHLRDLTSVDPANAGRWGHKAALAQVSAQMFGTKQAEPYRDLIWLAAEYVLQAGRAGDWHGFDDARANLHAILTEYELVAAPLSLEGRLYEAREAVAVPLFGVDK